MKKSFMKNFIYCAVFESRAIIISSDLKIFFPYVFVTDFTCMSIRRYELLSRWLMICLQFYELFSQYNRHCMFYKGIYHNKLNDLFGKTRLFISEKNPFWNVSILHLIYSNPSFNPSRSLSYRNKSIDLLYESMDWFLYDRRFRHERVNILRSN